VATITPFDPHANAPPLLTGDLPGVGGRIRAVPEDFRVDEIPAYSPSGEGPHLYVRFEKRGLDTHRAVAQIAKALDASPRDAGYAGQKDRHAITTQWASIAGGDRERALALALDGIRILEAAHHTNKLRTGHLRGNRFTLRIRDVRGTVDDARAIFDRLRRVGCPNYFGVQRFGRDNLARARAWLVEGGRAPRDRFDKKLLVSVLQSALFNAVVAERVTDGLLDDVVLGDLSKKEDTGGLFVATDVDAERPRVKRFEVSATGPMFGSRMRHAEGASHARELRVLAAAGLTEDDLARFAKHGEGTRRVMRVRPEEVEIAAEGPHLVVSFTLPKGAYATVIMNEVTKSPDPPRVEANEGTDG
jgi:tRNA pseudouridine13 synthase